MAVARTQSIAGTNGAGGPLKVTLSSAVTAGDLLFIVVGQYGKTSAGALATQTNWENLPVIQDNLGSQSGYNAICDRLISLYHRATIFVVPVVSVTGLQSFTIYTAAPAIVYAVEYSGLAGIFDGATQALVNFGTTWASPAITTSGTGMVFTYVGLALAQSVTLAATQGTLLSETDNATAVCSAGCVEHINTAAATYNPAGTTAATQEVGTITVAYK
jgi:hypothetical protein